MKTAQTSIPLPPNAIKEMNTPKASAFYLKFLRNESDFDKLPAWILPKLVADGQITMAKRIFPKIEKSGEALEWAYLLLAYKETARDNAHNAISLKQAAPEHENNHQKIIYLLNEKEKELSSLLRKIVSEVDKACRKGYQIKTQHIREHTKKLWD